MTDQEAADYYTDVILVGKSINEDHVHSAFLAGAKWKNEETKKLIESMKLIRFQMSYWSEEILGWNVPPDIHSKRIKESVESMNVAIKRFEESACLKT